MSVAVSFVIPAYRSAVTLGRTLRSIHRQTDGDWEAIVVDDGSDDRTCHVARNWCARDTRISLIEAEHGGASRARNSGIAAAQGEWIVFLDADDTIDRAFLKHMRRVAARRGDAIAAVACGYDRVDTKGRVSMTVTPLPLEEDPVLVCASGPPGAIHSFLVRRRVITQVGGFDETLVTNEDWDLWLRIALTGARFAITDRVLATYWSSPDSLSRRSARMLKDSRVVMERARALKLKAGPGLEIYDHGAYTPDDIALRDAFWSIGVEIGQGDTALSLIDSIPAGATIRGQITHLVDKFLDGLVVGSSAPISEQVLLWPKIADRVEAFFDAAIARTDSEPSKFTLMIMLETLLARYGRFRGSIPMGLVEALSLRPVHLLRGYHAAPGTEIVLMRMKWMRPATIFSFGILVFGPLTGIDMIRAIRRSTVRRALLRWRGDPTIDAVLARIGRLRALTRRALGLKSKVPSLPRFSALERRSRERLDAISAEIAALPGAPAFAETEVHHPGAGSSAEEWNRFFAGEDPWNYGSPYEQCKYRRTLGLIPANPGMRALELACAEGRFTELLAPTVQSLLAADISETAIERARRRTSAFDNVSFKQHDLFHDPVPRGFDLITCSEVLYFAPSQEKLAWVAGEIAESLNPGGHFAHAHAYDLADSPDRTAFDWGNAMGAASIHAAFAAVPGLAHVRTIETDLYRIDLFKRVAEGDAHPAPVIETLPVGAPVEPRVAAGVVWNGPIRTRASLAGERTYKLPVIRIDTLAPAALEAVLRFLRRRGFASVTPDTLDHFAARAGSLRGRPVMLVAYDRDPVARAALWEMVRANGFELHLFVQPGADTDWHGLTALCRQGMTVGSGMFAGRPADNLPNTQLLDDAIRSRLLIERMTGMPVRTASREIYQADGRVEQILAAAGYQRLFLSDGGIGPVCGMEMMMPTIRLPADLSLEDLAAALGPDVEAPDAGDAPIP